jgi:type IV secretion system protein VirB10
MNSPNSLQTPKVAVTKMQKWPLYLVLLALIGMFGVLVYYVSFHTPQKKVPVRKVEVETVKPLAEIEGKGLSLPAPSVTPRQPEIGSASKDAKMAIIDQEARELERQRTQTLNKALVSPLLAKREAREKPVGTKEQPVHIARKTADDERPMQEGEYNPAADRDKEGFLNRTGPDEWRSPYSREAGRACEIKTGTVIPGLMITGINSDLPGSMIAQVSQDVYDTATGRDLLVPQGSKIYGIYDSRVVYGQSRVLIAWNRIIFPDGSAVTLGTMPGADMAGYAGFTDQVNNHYMRIFGSAMLMSLITGGTSYATDSMPTTGNSDQPTVQSALAASLATQLGQTTQTLLQRNLNIKPTLEIRPGYQFNIIVTKDVAFKESYRR